MRPQLLFATLFCLVVGCRNTGKTGDTSAIDACTWYTDGDGDGWGDGASATEGTCDEPPAGAVAQADDCDDGDAQVHPGAQEDCDGLDDDCDGRVDDGVMPTWYTDSDGDGFGTDLDPVAACAAPDGTVPVGGDCDDADAGVFPGAEERCNGVDDDCDGGVDDGVADAVAWYADLDGDGYGDADLAVEACAAPDGYVADATDCDDGNDRVHPDAAEACDGVDNDCDDEVDEDVTEVWFVDADDDDWGDVDQPVADCDPGPGFAADAGDCDDHNSSIHPDATEVCDRLDNDCDDLIDDADPDLVDVSTWYVDEDGDGWGVDGVLVTGCEPPAGASANPGDCDDANASVNPDADEVCNGLDDDCDGATDDDDTDVVDAVSWYLDTDGDGWGTDIDVIVSCEAPEGYAAYAGDCDDTDTAFHPDAEETDCDDPNDYNCDGSVGWSDADADGWAACAECDDGDPGVSPSASETCDGVDNDCDGAVDEPDAVDATEWFVDGDGDAWGDPATGEVGCTPGPGTVPVGSDCDDTQARVNPGEDEVCDGLDNDCDGLVDGAGALDATVWYSDVDGDGYGTAAAVVWDCTAPTGFASLDGDCDDSEPDVNPGAIEVCDGLDNDCDATVDEPAAADALVWYLDSDGDGYGDPVGAMVGCTQPTGTVADATDCEDADAGIHPGADEVCDGRDNDCDGLFDEDSGASSTWYRDADGDGYGDAGSAITSCVAPTGYVANGDDCLDSEYTVNPGGVEACNDWDDDCDGLMNDGDPSVTGLTTFYVDDDGDGYGQDGTGRDTCFEPVGYGPWDGDCDDTDPAFHPDAAETDCADPNDYNCDGFVGYADSDGDGYPACLECDDGDAAVFPGAFETCNGIDDDCDGSVDETGASGTATWYADADGDGYGDPTTAVAACEAPSGYVSSATDCDDSRAATNPGAFETCNGVDDDCDGATDEGAASGAPSWYTDADGDGYGDPDTATVACTAPAGYLASGTDCDDTDPSVNPSATEHCDGEDDDCDGTVDESTATDALRWYRDADGDGYGDASSVTRACTAPTGYVSDATDCDDTAMSVHPGATETCDLVDEDCDGTVDEGASDGFVSYRDADRDGYGDPATSTAECTIPTGYVLDATDCDDTDVAVNPGAMEVCNGVDDDCDGTTDEASAADVVPWYRDADADGYGDAAVSVEACTAPSGYLADATDCDDTRSDVHPGAAERCNSLDDDCDGTTDESSAVDAPTWYRDADSDGFGNAASSTRACTEPSGWVDDATDCDDASAAVNPAATEVCNGLDDDCDGTADEGGAADAATWYRDADGDGYGDAATSTSACSLPTGYVADRTDCDDRAAAVNPGATEVCNGTDDDCDGSIDETSAADASTWYRDADGDGYGDAGSSTVACTAPTGYLADATDCDDSAAAVSPGAAEACNGIDDDCDGSTDETSAVDAPTWYRDVDGDGYGDAGTTTRACTVPSGYVSDATDCDDTVVTIYPGATEFCNSNDDDCDGAIDEGATDSATWYRDSDRDGFGDASVTRVACIAPYGYVLDRTDCDDDVAAVNPGADEVCNGTDDDCDGATDESSAIDAATWYRDADGDGYGDPASSSVSCTAPSGYVSDATDCDDARAATNPGAAEVCNGSDDDCDGTSDETSAVDASTWYRDADGDGYGNAASSTRACTAPSGYVSSSTDCNDAAAAIHPAATEVCDGLDNDCDGSTDESSASDAATWYRDADGDGYGDPASSTRACTAPAGYVSSSTDCNDATASVNPGATEYCNGADDDCDGSTDESSAADARTWYQDTDADGYGNGAVSTVACAAPTGYTGTALDCDDTRASVNPGATEYCNGRDDDCDGSTDESSAADAVTWYRDADADGYGTALTTTRSCSAPTGYVSGSTDCNDASASVHPGASEYCNSVDDDCDGSTDESAVDASTWYRDADGDNYGTSSTSTSACSRPTGYVSASTDCDDSRSSVYPGATEYCNSRDDDCDGTTDESSAVDALTWYRDADADGYGNSALSTVACSAPSGYVSDKTDCDDTYNVIYPGAAEACDSYDNDCDGSIDEGGVCPCYTEFYGTHTYLFCPYGYTWESAQSWCWSYGYTLANIGSSAEDSWINSTADAYSTGKWWFGLNDRASEGTWANDDGGAVTYTNWYSGEPNDSGGEDCAQLNRFHPSNGWNDEPCSAGFYFICEAY